MVTKSALKKLKTSIGRIADIASPSEENAQSILQWIMPDLDPSELKRALQYYYKFLATNDERYRAYFDPLPGLFSKYTFIQKHMGMTIKIGRNWWPYIQEYIRNPNYVVDMIGSKNMAIKRMLSTELGQNYMIYYTSRLHTFFELYFFKFPRYHNNCGGLIIYGLVNKASNSWGFYCRKDMTPIAIDDLDALTYQKRIYPVSNMKMKGSAYVK